MFQFGKKSTDETPAPEPALAGLPASTDVADVNSPARDRKPEATAALEFILDQILLRIEPAVAVQMTRGDLTTRIDQLVAQIANEQKVLLNQHEQQALAASIVDDMIGLGPLEPAAARYVRVGHADQRAADDLCRAAGQAGADETSVPKQRVTSCTWRSASRLRLGGASTSRAPCSMHDWRTAAASTSIIPPLSLKGPCISIRKFSKTMMSFASFIDVGTVSPQLARALEIAARVPLEYHHLRRHRFGQDDAAQCPFGA